jgi:DNA-binding transcriptional regulator YiaG
MKKINLLDKALIDYLEALNDPKAFTDWPAAKQAARRALIQWDNALFSAGVYRLAAQGEAAIWAESATITEDQWTAFALATLLTQLPSYNADVFLKLSQAKTFEDRKAIRKEAGNGVHSLKELKKWHLHVAKQYGKKVIEEAETRAREADRELDKNYKLATIKLADTIPAMMAQQAAPAAKTRRRGEVTQKEAANICGVTVFTIRAWDRGKHTPEGYPGRENAVTLKAWAGRKAEGEKLKAVVTSATRYGNIDRVSHKAERKGGYR